MSLGGGLGIPPGVRRHIGGGYVDNAGICMEAAGNCCILNCDTTDIRYV